MSEYEAGGALTARDYTVEMYFKKMPAVSKFFVIGSLVLGLLCTFDVLSPLQLYLNISMITDKFELWRIVTNLVYIGNLKANAVNFAFHFYLLLSYLRALEDGAYYRRTADLMWLILLTAIIQTVPIFVFEKTLSEELSMHIHFLSPSIIFMFVTLWARIHRGTNASWLFGILNFDASWCPWFWAVVSLMLSNNPVIAGLGMLQGYLFGLMGHNAYWLKAPIVLRAVCGELD
jgi:Derlin-2/3